MELLTAGRNAVPQTSSVRVIGVASLYPLCATKSDNLVSASCTGYLELREIELTYVHAVSIIEDG